MAKTQVEWEFLRWLKAPYDPAKSVSNFDYWCGLPDGERAEDVDLMEWAFEAGWMARGEAD